MKSINGFNFSQTKSYVEFIHENGEWNAGTLIKNSSHSKVHIASTVINYGQSCFEGIKAFMMKDGKIRVFRPALNASRMRESCRVASMPEVDDDLFLKALEMVITDNSDFCPDYNSGCSLYLRPVVFGDGPQIAPVPSPTFKFIVYLIPVGEYYGGLKPVKALIKYGFDRASPFGQGHVKLGGNYAPPMKPTVEAKNKGFQVLLFLDSKKQKFVEEFSTSNFIALSNPDATTGKRVYSTSKSRSILPSITNLSLMEVAEKMFGWTVEQRRIQWKEVLEGGKFAEVGACGTAVVITPVNVIVREVVKQESKKIALLEKQDESLEDEDFFDEYNFKQEDLTFEEATFSDEVPGLTQLYEKYKALQRGDLEVQEWFSDWMWPANGL